MRQHPQLCKDKVRKYEAKERINPLYGKMSQQVAKIINYNIDERFDTAMIIHYKDPESGEEITRWEKIEYKP